MPRYIDADNLIADFESVGGEFDVDGIKYIINTYHKPADVVPVVRCKDCRFLGDENIGLHDCDHFRGPMRVELDDFCSYGERKCD